MAGSGVKRRGKEARLEVSSMKKKKKATKPKCDVCTKIISALNRGVNKYLDLDLGSFESVMVSTACNVHPRMLNHYFKEASDEFHLRQITGFKILNVPKHYFTRIHACQKRNVIYPICELDVLPEPSRNGPNRRGKIVNPQWIEKSVFRRWKHSCDRHQNRNCLVGTVAARLAPIRPTWLIDTWRLCLVRGDNGAPYVALSYVWGKSKFFKASKENFDQLRKNSALADSHQSLGVPMTIANAISIVELLGERYLWVDALCIVQDDETMKHDQIENMASIFANASITIIAVGGEDANYGLRGLVGISPPRSFSQDIFTIQKRFSVVSNGLSNSHAGAWACRAWTFQENQFSRRRLTFCSNSVRWDCACSSYQETVRTDMILRPSPSYIYREGIDVFSSPFPDLFLYVDFAVEYSTRELSYEADAMAAFAGITTVLSHTFYGGFICCLPVLFLDVALCWQSDNSSEKRLPFSASVLNKNRLPSWSWVGWKGQLNRATWFGGSGYIKHSETMSETRSQRSTIPLVQWYSRECINSEPRPIEAPLHAQELKEASLRGEIDLPRGWSRFKYVPSPTDRELIPDPTHLQYFYKHESDPNTEFWYPIPLCSQQTQKQNYDSLLSCFTKRAFLFLAERFESFGRTPRYSILDDQGRRLGDLQPNEEMAQSSQEPGSRDKESWFSCELVAISRGYRYEGSYDPWAIEESRHDGRPRAGGKEPKDTYYNVLWVEWVDGIAYRKGSGRIGKSAWEDQELEQIELILG